METRYLTHVLTYIEQVIAAEELLRLYDEAGAALRTTPQTTPPSIPYAVYRPLAALLAAHRRIEPHGWSITEGAIYANLGAGDVLGAAACARIESVMHLQRTQPITAAEEIQHLRATTAQLAETAGRLREELAAALSGAAEPPSVDILPVGGSPRAATRPTTRQSLARWPAAWRNWLTRPQTAALVAVATPVVVTLASVLARGLTAYRRALTAATPIRPIESSTPAAQPNPTIQIIHQTTIISVHER